MVPAADCSVGCEGVGGSEGSCLVGFEVSIYQRSPRGFVESGSSEESPDASLYPDKAWIARYSTPEVPNHIHSDFGIKRVQK
jgi:hypothetical protein